MKFELSLYTGLTIFLLGLAWFLYSWIYLAVKLGICPGLYHSTLCTPSLKRDSLIFKSSNLFEFGIANGIIDTGLLLCFSETIRPTYLLLVNLIAFYALFSNRIKHFLSDFLGLLLIFLGNLLLADYSFDRESVYSIGLAIFLAKALFLSNFAKQLEEAKSAAIISLLLQGFIISVLGYKINGLGEITDILSGFTYSLFSYTFLESCKKENPSIILSIITLLIYAYLPAFSIWALCLSSAGIVLLIFGVQLFSLCHTRLNISLAPAENRLSTALL